MQDHRADVYILTWTHKTIGNGTSFQTIPVSYDYDMRIKWCHSYMSCDLLRVVLIYLYVTWTSNLLKLHSAISKRTTTITLVKNKCQNEMVAYLHVTWPNHAIVIKAAAPKVALMKGAHLDRPRSFWLYDILTNEKCINSVYSPSPFLLEGGGFSLLPNFQKGMGVRRLGGLTGSQLLEGGCCKLKSEIFNYKKQFINKKCLCLS